MEKIFNGAAEIATRENYDNALMHLKTLIKKATDLGALDSPEADNEYTREIGRIGRLCADYESKYIPFEHIKALKKAQPSPALRKVRNRHLSPAFEN